MNYIGIDIGDGESCVCVLPQNSGIEPYPISITGRKSFLSAVAVNECGEPLIGMDAVSDGLASDFAVRFKSRFLGGEERDLRDMRRFLRGICAELKRQKLLMQDDKVVLGCPAGWTSRAREDYLAMIREAGFPQPRLVSESRAAFLYAKHARSIRLDTRLLQRSALVIDIGSSTLDFAYVCDGRESGVGTFGDVYLGGGALDEAILDSAVNTSPHRAELKATFMEAPEWKSHALLVARRLKEDYFIRQSQGKTDVQVRETVNILYDEPLELPIRVDEQLIWRSVHLGLKALNGQSFFQMLDSALAHAMEQTRERPPELVILTGGASRMQFFQEQCIKRFPDASMVLCDEPEFSIAKGLAFAGRVDEEIFAFNAEIQAFLESGILQASVERHMPKVQDALTRTVTDIIFAQMKEAVRQWQRGGYATLDELNRALPGKLKENLESSSPREAAAAAMNEQMAEICLSIQSEIDRICLAHHVEQSHMQLVKTAPLSPEALQTSIRISDETSYLTRPLQIAITGAVAGALLLIPGGGIVDLVLIAATAATVALGGDWLQNVTTAMNIPLFLRSRMDLEKLVTPALREKLRMNICDQLQKDASLWNNIMSAVEESISEHVRNMARRTEVAIISEGDGQYARRL